MARPGSVRTLAIAGALAMGACVLASCGIDEHYTGMGTGALPGDKLYPQPDPGPSGCNCAIQDATTGGDIGGLDAADLAGFAYRFDSLALSKPLPDSIAPLVNDTVTQQIADQLINVLLVIDSDDRDAGTLAGRLGTADTPAEGVTAYSFAGTPEPVTFTLSGRTFESSADASLSISVTMGTDPALVLPVKALRLKGVLSADGTSIASGTLTGAITEADGANVLIPLFGDLKTFLETQDPPIEPDTTVGDQPAWSFAATYTAAAATVQ